MLIGALSVREEGLVLLLWVGAKGSRSRRDFIGATEAVK
ncbi:uncharacterized protein G2W53_015839 [Senna tora]|uniref:Uncharacterized protein n=1 Tax=Senna tora TaxID=362788 RepID=A0A835C8P1_9FABA|nr:uncharacterized protein G2W53_015839 [Senna tora]